MHFVWNTTKTEGNYEHNLPTFESMGTTWAFKSSQIIRIQEIKHTHASEASKIVPNVQKVEKTTIHMPLFEEGTNSRNQEENTGPPARPIPTKKRRITRYV